ncbi:dihydrolipoamide acetyltransferase family protein [Streptomyces sp. x-80]|uniref:dihydrolipoamide acetyltransferase family protein n=1 Tax=Streptomyces sp. x-80 TaxID=2789282 RepID=UPI003980DA40
MPSMREFRLPDLGEGLVAADVVKWLVRTGDLVAVDQPVIEVETAKATVEVPCPYGGVVSELCVPEGGSVAVGAALIRVAVEEPAAPGPASETDAEEASGQVLVGYGTSGRVRRRRTSRALGPSASVAAAPGAAGPGTSPPVLSPVVRRLARTQDIDLTTLRGSGPEGLILRSDVESAIQAREDESARAPAGPAAERRTPLRGVRAAAAEKFSRSRREIPHVTCWVDADATALLAAREQLAQVPGPRLGLLALLARISVAALGRFPQFNSRVDTRAGEIVRLPEVNLGFAAQSARGLVVPVVRGADRMSTGGLAAELSRLTAAARDGALRPTDLTGGTFTLNNYGVFGADGATPILDHPQAAMLGAGRVTARPWVHEGGLAVRQVVQLSFTFDHRVCDGAEAGGFLRFVADCVECPTLLLRHC